MALIYVAEAAVSFTEDIGLGLDSRGHAPGQRLAQGSDQLHIVSPSYSLISVF